MLLHIRRARDEKKRQNKNVDFVNGASFLNYSAGEKDNFVIWASSSSA